MRWGWFGSSRPSETKRYGMLARPRESWRSESMTNEQAASALRESAVLYLIHGLKAWPDDVGMRAMHWTDACDMRIAASLFEEGRLDEAREAILKLDTSINDIVPVEVWDRVQGF